MPPSAETRGGGIAELRIVLGLVALAVLLVAVERWPRSDEPPLPSQGQMAAMETAWQELLQDLQEDAERAAEALRRAGTVPIGSTRARQNAFEELDRASRAGDRTLVLIDPDELAQAWGGPGLRHDLPLDRLLPGGINQSAGFTAVSLYAAVDMSSGEGGWRLVVGSSFPTDELPVPKPFALRHHGARWSVRDHSAEPLTPALEATGIRELAPPAGVPGPWLRFRFGPAGEAEPGGADWFAFAAVAIAVGMLLVWAFRRWSARRSERPRRTAGLLGLAVAAAAVGHGLFRWQIWWANLIGSPADLGDSIGGPIGHWIVLLVAWVLLAGTALWATGWREGRDWMHVLLTATAAAVGVGLLVEATHRPAERALLSERVQAGLDAPDPEEVAALARETSSFVRTVDLRSLALGDPKELDDHQDLALALWRQSPLAGSETFSALAVLREDGVSSSFSYGLPVDPADGELAVGSARWPGDELPIWQQQRNASGEVALASSVQDDRRVVRYWTAAFPGLDAWSSVTSGADSELELRLLRGGPIQRRSASRPAGQALIAYVDGAGRPLVSRWREDWRLPAPSEAVDPRRPMRVETPAGRALAWFSPTSVLGLWTVVLLPEPTATERLWRIATVAVRLLLALTVVAFALLLISLPTAKLRGRLLPDARRYSVRLTAVLALVAIVPLTALNGLLFRNLGARTQAQQEAAGRAALVSLEHVLTDFLLGLEAGYSMDAQLDDELLAWLAEVVDHEVNLYWRGSVYASTKLDLFTAGLMPKRIPGTVYARLALLGHPTAARVQSTGAGASYLELYAPVSLGEERPGESGLFVSVPLLAQQEAATRELGALRRQSLVITTALVLVLVTVGARLARGFTRPLMRMIDGADRIAGGATALGFEPEETELKTLAFAIDGMAERIASTRAREEAEKTLLEGVVENITSGVVSLDGSGHVLMANRTAAGLLGVTVGQSLAETPPDQRIEASLEAVSTLVRRFSTRIEQITVSLGHGDERRDWTVVWAPVPGEGDPAALLVIEDVTDVLRAQRLEAWAEMARLIAHEVKNPLTPIRLSTEHLRQVWREAPERLEEVFERCTGNILAQVEELAHTAGEFGAYSRIPLAQPVPGDLASAVGEVVDGYRYPSSDGVSVAFESRVDASAALLPFDRRLVQRAVRNLLENAVGASENGGEVQVTVAPADGDGALAVTVDDRGPGVSDTDLERIFEPYFSTSSGGTGLGLPIARRIAREHGGSISARRRRQGGLSVRIVLPAAQASEASPGCGSR